MCESFVPRLQYLCVCVRVRVITPPKKTLQKNKIKSLAVMTKKGSSARHLGKMAAAVAAAVTR